MKREEVWSALVNVLRASVAANASGCTGGARKRLLFSSPAHTCRVHVRLFASLVSALTLASNVGHPRSPYPARADPSGSLSHLAGVTSRETVVVCACAYLRWERGVGVQCYFQSI